MRRTNEAIRGPLPGDSFGVSSMLIEEDLERQAQRGSRVIIPS